MLAKIRLGRKWLKLSNTLANYDTATITAVNSFIVQALVERLAGAYPSFYSAALLK